MRKHPVLIFVSIISLLILGAVLYIQSSHFAKVVKEIAIRHLPANAGIQGDFDHLKIMLFPPGVAVVNPQIVAKGENPANIPIGSEVRAEQLDLIFRPLQIISGRVQVNEVRIIRGNIKTDLRPAPKKKKADLRLSWEDLFQIRADRLELEDTRVELGLPDQKIRMSFNARKLALEKLQEDDRSFYDLFLYVDSLKAEVPDGWQYPDQVDSLRTHLELDQEGIKMQNFELIREGTQVLASGAVKGDLLSGKDLLADVEVEISANLNRMLQFLTKKSDRLPSGHVNFKGAVKMLLDRPEDSIQASGLLKGENIAFANYEFAQAEVEGSYSAKSQGNAIRVKRAVLEGPQVPRVGGHQPGSGGRLELGAFEFYPDKPAPIQTTLKLKDAHIHWLSAIIREALYPLDGRITGDATLQFTPPASANESFRLDADLKWSVAGFQLDNQRYLVEKKMNRILAIPNLHLEGKINVRKKELNFDGIQVFVEKSRFQVNGGIKFLDKTTYDIQAGGQVDLSELTVLAENKISGTGLLGVHVSGPADRVFIDFDGDIRDLMYLRLHFGDFRGRISWEDDPNLLHFRNLDCNRERTKYRLDGHLDLGDNETMEIAVKVPSGNIADFNGIFQELVEPFWWYPSKVAGPMTGEMRVHGGIALDEMKVDAVINGTGWDFYTERFQKVFIKGGYDRGKYFVSDGQIQKKNGRVLGKISYDANQYMQWDVRTEGFTVVDFDHLARLEIPIRGKILAKSQGAGPDGNVESFTEIQVLDTMVRGKRYPSSELSIVSQGGVASILGQVAGGQGKLDMKYAFDEGRDSSLKIEAKNLDFAPGVLLLNPELVRDEKLVGVLSGDYELRFQTGKSELGSGHARLSQYLLSREGVQFSLERPVESKIEQGSFSFPSIAILGPAGKVTARLKSDQGKLSGSFSGRADLSAAEFVTSVVQTARGYANVDFQVGGTLKRPTLGGEATIRDGMVKIPALESPFENIAGKIDLKNGLLRVLELDGDLAGGGVSAGGSIDFYLDRFPVMNLNASLSGNRLKVYPFQVAKVRGKIQAKGTTLPYLVTGGVLVESAISREKIADSRGPGLRTAQYTPPPRMRVASDFPLFKLDIDVSAPGNIIVQNEILDVEAKGDLKIVGTLENPRPLGTAQAIQGKVLFKDRVFVIQSGKVEFDSPTTINPRFEVVGNTEITNRKIQMAATGRFDRYKIEFTSNPPMPESEILSLLALGISSDDAKRQRNVDRSAYQQGEAASLILHSLDFNREVQNKTGLQIGIDEVVDDQTGQSVFRRSTEENTTAGPKVVIRRRFGDRLNLSVGSTVGVGTSVQREVNAEVNVTRGLSVLGVWDTFEGADTDESRRSSYGVDLKVQKRFK